MTSSDTPLVTLSSGVTVSCAVLAKLLDIEARGCTFELLSDGRICVRPLGPITPAEIEFLKRHRDEARRILEYQANVAGIGLLVWAVMRKRGASTALLPPIASPPLVSPWSPLP